MQRKPIKVDWDALEEAFDSRDPEVAYYLDRITGHVVLDGEGEEKNFKADESAHQYSLDRYLGLPDTAQVDLIRQKWVSKDQFGWVPSLLWEHPNGRLIIGGDAYTFASDHWGDVLLVEGFTPDDMPGGLRYHDYNGDKTAWSVYAIIAIWGLISLNASMTTFPLTDWMGSTTTATHLGWSISKLCWVFTSVPESQHPNPGWE